MIIIPNRGISHPLRDALRNARDQRNFRHGVALSAAFTAATRRVMANRTMTKGEGMQALLTALVSYVQAAAPPTEWDDTGKILAEEIRARLTVTGDTGDDHHAREMI